VLTAAPYSLLKGYTVYVKVVAVNDYGDSIPSQAGNGAIIVLVPDAPLNFENDPTITTRTVIGLQWSDGVSDGGTAVIDYRLMYEVPVSGYVELDSGILTQSY
jgi:hypothetical protein